MKIFNIDLHISVIEDISRILNGMDHQITSVNMSGHTWVFGRPQQSTEVVTPQNWMRISPEMCRAFHDRYKDELAGYDAFITTHLPCLAWLFRDFTQPMYVVCSTRYEAPFNRDAGLWDEFDRYLREGSDSGKVVLLANNRYDARYVEHFVGRPCLVIPSICQYAKASYAPTDPRFLLYGVPPLPGVPAGLAPFKEVLPSGHSWADVARFRGIVAIPYNVSTMSFFEFYRMGIPLFVPSLRFMLELKAAHPGQVLSQVAWDQIDWMRATPPARPVAGGPNDHEAPGWAEWLALADFYDPAEMPHITYFDSWGELSALLAASTDASLAEASRSMLTRGAAREASAVSAWSNLFPAAPAPPRGDLVGYWKWTPTHVGLLREDGTFEQIRHYDGARHVGEWRPAPGGFAVTLTGHWTARVTAAPGGSVIEFNGDRTTARPATRMEPGEAEALHSFGRRAFEALPDQRGSIADTGQLVLVVDHVASCGYHCRLLWRAGADSPWWCVEAGNRHTMSAAAVPGTYSVVRQLGSSADSVIAKYQPRRTHEFEVERRELYRVFVFGGIDVGALDATIEATADYVVHDDANPWACGHFAMSVVFYAAHDQAAQAKVVDAFYGHMPASWGCRYRVPVSP